MSIAAAFSLLLCTATLALWVRSYWICDSLEWVSRHRTRFVACKGGRVLLQVNRDPSRPEEWDAVDHHAYVLKRRDSTNLGRPWRFGGFWVENLTFAPTAARPTAVRYTDFVVPLYAVVLASLVLPAAAGRKLASRLRRGAGFCRQCGYDLRATPDRCPECGCPRTAA